MNKFIYIFLIFMISQKNFAEKRFFSNQDKQNLEDKIIKYDFEKKIVLLEKNGKVPINKFSNPT